MTNTQPPGTLKWNHGDILSYSKDGKRATRSTGLSALVECYEGRKHNGKFVVESRVGATQDARIAMHFLMSWDVKLETNAHYEGSHIVVDTP